MKTKLKERQLVTTPGSRTTTEQPQQPEQDANAPILES